MFARIRTAPALFSVALVVLATACGGGASPPSPQPAFEGNLNEVLEITVINQQLDDARIWLRYDGQRVRLGDVRGNATATFHHPMTRITVVRMEFDLTLGRNCVSADRSLGPGDRIDVTIPTNLNMMPAVCRGM